MNFALTTDYLARAVAATKSESPKLKIHNEHNGLFRRWLWQQDSNIKQKKQEVEGLYYGFARIKTATKARRAQERENRRRRGFYAQRAGMVAERCSSYGGSADLANVGSVIPALRAGRILRLGAAAGIRGFSA